MFTKALSYMSDDSDDDWLDCSLDEFERSRILSLSRKERKEERMQKIETEISKLQDQVDNVQIELEFRKGAGQEAANAHAVVVMQFKEKMDTLKWALNTKLTSETRRRSSLGSYVTTMRSVAGPGTMYVQSIQGQACRAVHIVSVQKRQRDMMNQHAKSFCAYMQKQVVAMESEHAELTKNILTRQFELGCEKRELAKNYERLVKAQEATLDGQRFTESLRTTGLTASLAVKEASVTRTSRPRPTRRASLSHFESLPEQAPNKETSQLDSNEKAVEIKEQSTEQVAEQPRRRMMKRRSSLGGFMMNPFGMQAAERRRSSKSAVGEAGIELRDLSSSASGKSAREGEGMFTSAALVQAMGFNDDSSQLAERLDTKEEWEGKNSKAATQVC